MQIQKFPSQIITLLRTGILRGDDRVRQRGLSHRVVPLWMHESDHEAQGEVVLPQVHHAVQEEKVMNFAFTLWTIPLFPFSRDGYFMLL